MVKMGKSSGILIASKEQALLEIWNNTKHTYSKDKCVHALFEEVVEKSQDRIAVVFEDRQLTYEVLNQRTNQLARYLKKNQVRPEVLVGISVPRGFDLIIGLLGILKSGGTYVPLDPEYPKDRLEYMLEDSKIKIVLTTTQLRGQFKGYKGKIIYLDKKEYLKEPSANLSAKILPDNLAYVIYTSGSTGKPKGVAVSHYNIKRLFQSTCGNYNFNKDDVWILLHSYSFDVSVWEIWGALFYGGKLIIVDSFRTKDVSGIYKKMLLENVTILNQTPSAFERIVLYEQNIEYGISNLNLNLRNVVFAGEELNFCKLIPWVSKHGLSKPVLVNMYGITETTVHVTYCPVVNIQQSRIGNKLVDLSLYILDEYLNLMPIGTVGELYVGGAGLARGYLNRPGLTAERFIPNPFAKDQEKGSRLYRTGDLGRYLEDGNIEFLGRIDQQVKIRGFRIELGEIESTIQGIKGIKQCVVLAREDIENQKRLVGYVVLEKDKEESKLVKQCREICKSRLPDYMQPSQVIVLKSLPLTPNGKIDRKALPAPEGREGLDTFEKPVGLLEEQLANIWKEILKIEKIGRNDNFFNLGGHSLLATQVISRIRSSQKVEVPLKAIFEYPILKDLAKAVEQEYFTKGLLPPIYPTKEKVIPLSFAQQRLWFLEQLLPDLGLYHIPIVLRLTGDLNEKALIKSLNTIVKRHEILRTKIVTTDGVAHQDILDLGFNLKVEKIEKSEERLLKRIKEETTRTFNFDTEVLFRGLLLESDTTEHVLILTFHHIISDGWSMGIFNRELAICYEAYLSNQMPKLSDLPIQYKDYSIWQREWLQGEVLTKQLVYWEKQLSGVSTLALPSKPRPKEQSYRGGCCERYISEEILSKLNKLAKEKNVTLFMVLLASFKGVLSRICGQNDIIIGTPIANRKISEIEQLVGFFVNTLVLRTNCSNNITFEELTKRVEKVTLEAYEHQDVPFEQLVDYLNIPRDLSKHPLFQVVFILQNIEGEETKLSNLKLSPIITKDMLSKFDLTLNIVETKKGLYIGYEYATDLFDDIYIARLHNYYMKFIERVLNNPSIHISEIPILTEAELAQLRIWNDTQHEYPKDKCVHELFEEVVENKRDRVAVICENRQLTYEVLNKRANQLAHYLKKYQVRPGSLVGISVPRGLELIVGLLGILKSGGVYVPLDPKYPKDRLEYMLEDANIKILLTISDLKEQFKGYKGDVIYLDKNEYLSEPVDNLNTKILSSGLIYIVYTSGTTGNPKGAMVEHKGVVS